MTFEDLQAQPVYFCDQTCEHARNDDKEEFIRARIYWNWELCWPTVHWKQTKMPKTIISHLSICLDSITIDCGSECGFSKIEYISFLLFKFFFILLLHSSLLCPHDADLGQSSREPLVVLVLISVQGWSAEWHLREKSNVFKHTGSSLHAEVVCA